MNSLFRLLAIAAAVSSVLAVPTQVPSTSTTSTPPRHLHGIRIDAFQLTLNSLSLNLTKVHVDPQYPIWIEVQLVNSETDHTEYHFATPKSILHLVNGTTALTGQTTTPLWTGPFTAYHRLQIRVWKAEADAQTGYGSWHLLETFFQQHVTIQSPANKGIIRLDTNWPLSQSYGSLGVHFNFNYSKLA